MASQSKRIRTLSPLSDQCHSELSRGKEDNNLPPHPYETHGSSSLQLMLGKLSMKTFFEDFWQQKPMINKCVSVAEDKTQEKNSTCESKAEALQALIHMTWDTLADIHERSRSLFHTLDDLAASTHNSSKGIDPPLIFQDQTPLQYTVIQEMYSSNPLAAYIDGCSIVINHVDLIHDLFSSLCVDLQGTFPHVYINTYLTPPNSCAVSAHADDRDVFVIQLLGTKQWQVYEAPILFPYSEEQVGKGLPVPKEILASTPLIETTLNPGNVLYMPRGFVHQARTLSSEPSFHATIAIATHDWTLARSIPNLIQKALESIPKYRTAMPLWLLYDDISSAQENPQSKKNHGMHENERRLHEQAFQIELDHAIQHAIKQIDVSTIQQEMAGKIHRHNIQAKSLRLQFQEWWNHSKYDFDSKSNVVGSKAARLLNWKTSMIRSATPEERSFARHHLGSRQVGVTVREESREALISIRGYFNVHTEQQVAVSQIRSLLDSKIDDSSICDFTLLCFVKCCVEVGSLAVV